MRALRDVLTDDDGMRPQQEPYRGRKGFCARARAHVPTAGRIAASDDVRQGPVIPIERVEVELMTMLDALIDPYIDHAEA